VSMWRGPKKASIDLTAAALLVAVDQLTKYWARLLAIDLPVSWRGAGCEMSLVLHYNSGSFLSLGADWPEGIRQSVFSL
jgi:lipoprotein signal peptidase